MVRLPSDPGRARQTLEKGKNRRWESSRLGASSTQAPISRPTAARFTTAAFATAHHPSSHGQRMRTPHQPLQPDCTILGVAQSGSLHKHVLQPSSRIHWLCLLPHSEASPAETGQERAALAVRGQDLEADFSRRRNQTLQWLSGFVRSECGVETPEYVGDVSGVMAPNPSGGEARRKGGRFINSDPPVLGSVSRKAGRQ